MAGDLDIREEVVVLGTRAEETGARAALSMERAGGRVLHQFGPRVMVMEVSGIAKDDILESVSGAAYAPTPSRLSRSTRESLDITGNLGYEALRLRNQASFRRAKENRPLESQAWDVSEALRPDVITEEPLAAFEAPLAADMPSPSPTSAFMIGNVAVGLIIVEGPSNDLKFTDAERTKVVAEVQNGLSWLATLEPKANLSWSYDIHIVSLDKPAAPNLPASELETYWRDPAMNSLGYANGLNNVLAYVQDLRSRLATRWGYCAFFTKYPTRHFAYASLGGPRLVMQYSNDGWGPDNIDRVFAHETGHIFCAPDEYATSGCNCGGQWGYLKTPNGNCVNCADNGGVACIMRSNEWSICDYTRTHFGWRDQDNDGVLDPDDPVSSPRWWLFRWLCRRYPDLCRFLSAPSVDEEEDLVPMSLLAQVLNPADMARLKERIQQEQAAYLRSIANEIQEASEGLQARFK